MEYSLSLNKPDLTAFSYQEIALPAPTTYFSTQDAYNLLQNKKVIHVDLKQDFSDRHCGSTILTVFVCSLMGGFWSFLHKSLESITPDHSTDVVTPYRCAYPGTTLDCEYFGKDMFVYERNKDGYIVNHTNDYMNIDYSKGLESGIKIAVIPPIVAISLWIIQKIFFLTFNTCNKRAAVVTNQSLDNTLASLKSFSEIDVELPVPSELIPELINLDLLKDEHYSLLSFEQIRSIQQNKPEFFEHLLNSNVFSEEQNLVLEILQKLLESTSAEELANMLQNNEHSEIFEQKPKIFEILIKELPKEYFTDNVKSILALKIGVIKAFENLYSKEKIQIIELMLEKGYSFELGFRNVQALSLEGDKKITLQFLDEKENNVKIEVSINLLISTSSYFKNLFEDSIFEGNENLISLNDVNLENFKEILLFLTTGILTSTTTLELLSLFKAAGCLEIDELLKKINTEIAKKLMILPADYTPSKLLQLGTKLHLDAFPKAIDLRISQTIMSKDVSSWFFSDDFFNDLKLICNFSLDISFEELIKQLSSNLEELLTNENFITQFIKCTKIHNKLFSLPKSLFDIKPHLLKELWDIAELQENTEMLHLLYTFCRQPEHLHLVLINWDMPPNIEIHQTSKENELIPLYSKNLYKEEI